MHEISSVILAHRRERWMRLALWIVVTTGGVGMLCAATDKADNYIGPVKITQLLWGSNPASAAQTLNTAIHKAMDRNQIEQLSNALESLSGNVQSILEAGDYSDPRWVPALAAKLIRPGKSAPDTSLVVKTLSQVEKQDAGLLADVWFLADKPAAFGYLNMALQRGETPHVTELIAAAMQSDRTHAAQLIIERWSQLNETARSMSVEPMTRSADTMSMLVESVGAGIISKDRVNTNQLRKWLQTDSDRWSNLIEPIWGKIRESDDLQRQQLVQQTLSLMSTGAQGSVTNGRALFVKVCAQCHVLHDHGFEVGPNLSNNGRGSLSQLVSNVLDPSLVIGEAFLARTVLTYDGTVISGLVVAENDRYLKLKIQGGEVVELDKQEDIERQKTSTKSLMPEGIETQMSQAELLDLFAYLCLVKPIDSADNELIPGTPEGFVQP